MSKISNRLLRRLALAALSGVLLAGTASLAPSAHAETVEIRDARGPVTVPARPERIVVYDLAALDTLDALGVTPAGVPEGVKPAYLEGYNDAGIAKVGTLFEPDLEALLVEAPDVVVIGGRSAAKRDELAAIAPTVDMTVDTSDFLPSAEARIRALATLVGKQDLAEAKLAEIEEATRKLQARAADTGTALVILTTGGRMSAYGPGSRFGILHTAFGLAPAVSDLDVATHGQAVSYEFLLKTDPDWLFVIDRDAAIGQKGEAAAAMLDNEIVRRTSAWKNGRVVYLDPGIWYLSGGGLTSLKAMVDEVSAALATEN